ncbi:Predicted transporter component [Chlamydia abortus]|uniref:sulfurtransferase TusA family protein n=1 Tax=Paenibacillus sp. SAFN-117 TaxID=3436860 RepID=UPI000A27CC18|nr:Predicted transporter component [Chlamydia abortus]
MRQHHLQVVGMVCPFPLVEAKKVMQDLPAGSELVIDFDCTQATESLPRWAATDGHEVTSFEQTDDAQWRIVIRKKK